VRAPVLLLLAFASAASGQFEQLATTDDGAQLVFVTHLRLRGSDESAQAKIIRYAGGLFETVQTPYSTLGAVTGNWFVTRPLVSGDGSLIAMTVNAVCVPCRFGGPGPRSAIIGRGEERIFTGTLDMSRNGRYAIAGNIRIDLETGESKSIPQGFAHGPGGIAWDGTVLLQATDYLMAVWHPERGYRLLNNGWRPVRAVLDDAATHALYQSFPEPGNSVELIALDLASGEETVLGSNVLRFSQSNDARTVVHVARESGDAYQAYVGRRKLTDEPGGITDVAVSGDGRVAWASTARGGLLRIRLETGEIERVIDSSPVVVATSRPAVPGSLLRIVGSGFGENSRVLLDGQPVPVLKVAPSEVAVQIPWEAKSGDRPNLKLETGASPFENAPTQLAIAEFVPMAEKLRAEDNVKLGLITDALAFHTDLTRAVSTEDPATPGETIHVRMTGLGPVSPGVATGEPAPDDPLARVLLPLRCRLSGMEMEIRSAVLEPGLVGLYRVSMVVPSNASGSRAYLECGRGDLFYGIAVVAVGSAPRP
jgi:uncharacterized protein (TIGR03437 family)